jgi:LysM repeat protein
VRKWTMSACVVLAWCVLPLVAAAGSREPGPTQAKISIATSITAAASISAAANNTTASSTRIVLASKSVSTRAARAADAAQPAATWTVRPGDTLSGIAAALGLPGGWQALYADNKGAVGSDPDVIRPGTVLAVPAAGGPVRYTVAPGDTLSGIAAALGVPGGWQSLYAANEGAVGSDPDVIRPGTVLAAPRPALAGARPAARDKAPRRAASAPVRPRHEAPSRQARPAPTTSQPTQSLQQAPVGSRPASSGQPTAPGYRRVSGHGTATATAAAGGMPRWLEDVLLAAGVLAASAFAAEPATALARRRKAVRPSRPSRPSRPARPRAPGIGSGPARRAAEKARIILADHERLIVTYSARDHTVYVLTPPGEDPQAVLSAARLILSENTYEDLAGHLGVPPAWPLE